jgi:hypothetical protein
MAKVTISKNDWSALSEVEREMMKKLGIGVAKEKTDLTTEIRKAIAPAGYILGVVEECKLCGEKYYHLYDMNPEETEFGSYLKATELPLGSAKPSRSTVRYRLTCISCERHLINWSKKDLVSKLIEFADMPTTKLKQRMAAREAVQNDKDLADLASQSFSNNGSKKKEPKSECLAGVDTKSKNRVSRRRSFLYTSGE